jgi:gamma-glutamylcyclotransferase
MPSNMCTGRLQQRVPSARPIAVAKLLNNSLRFHKRSDKDGSGKADAYFTGERENNEGWNEAWTQSN